MFEIHVNDLKYGISRGKFKIKRQIAICVLKYNFVWFEICCDLKSTRRPCDSLLAWTEPFSCFIVLFYATIDGYCIDHRGWELKTVSTHMYDNFVNVTPENTKVTRDFYFWYNIIKIEWETTILWSDLSPIICNT